MVSATQCSNLVKPPFDCLVRNFSWVSPFNLSVILDMLNVFRPGIAIINTPLGAVLHDFLKFILRYFYKALAANSGGDSFIELIHKQLDFRFYFIYSKISCNQAHSTIDVKTNAAGRNHAALLRVKRCYSADREAVAPVAIWHAESIFLNSRQSCHIRNLFKYASIHGTD